MYSTTLNLVKPGEGPPSQKVSKKIPQCCAFPWVGWLVTLVSLFFPTMATLLCNTMASLHGDLHHQTCEFPKPGTWSILFTQYC